MSEFQQNYYALKQICFATGKLFEDLKFEPPKGATDGVRWIRPTLISKSPKFIADGVSRFDVKQGRLGDCWLVAAMANLTLNSNLFDRVVPSDQSFDRGSYCGMFRFSFWRYGRWIEIVVDDRLPVDHDGRPLYVRSSDPNEFWSPLLEKAYAKMNGSYEAIVGGDFCEAMVDFTGGLTERFELLKPATLPKNLFGIIKKAFDQGSMIGCSILRKDIGIKIAGLVGGHAYSITKVAEIHDDRNQIVQLLRIRNPWGNEFEWNGYWSDRSNKWVNIGETEREKIHLKVQNDGEYWMSFDDWLKYFTHCELCHMTPEAIGSIVKHQWFPEQASGSWTWNFSSGGHLSNKEFDNNAKQFSTNPQYFLKLTNPDKDDTSGNCTLVIALMKMNNRSPGEHGPTIGFYIYAVTANYISIDSKTNRPKHLGEEFFLDHSPIETKPVFTYDRDVSARFHLKPGYYVIIPTTLEAGNEGEFMLRIWTEHKIKFSQSARADILNHLYAASCAPKIINGIPNTPDMLVYANATGSNPNNNQLCGHRGYANNKNHEAYNYEEIRYPSLHYEGRPRIVSFKVYTSPSRRIRINICVNHSNVNQHPAPKKKRGLLRKIFGLKPAESKNPR